MALSYNTAQLIDAAVAYGAVVAFQCIYSGLKFRGVLHAPDRSRLWVLVGLTCLFSLIGLVFSILSFHLTPDTAGTMITAWKISSVISICSTEVLEVSLPMLDPIIHSCPWSHKRPKVAKWIFWSLQLVSLIALVGMGLWVLEARQFELQLAAAAVSHMTVTVMAIYSYMNKLDNELLPLWLPWVEIVLGFCGFAMSITFVWLPHKASAQCLVCMVLIVPRGYRDRCKACNHDLDEIWCYNDDGSLLTSLSDPRQATSRSELDPTAASINQSYIMETFKECDRKKPNCDQCTAKRRTCNYQSEPKDVLGLLRDLPQEQAYQLLNELRKSSGQTGLTSSTSGVPEKSENAPIGSRQDSVWFPTLELTAPFTDTFFSNSAELFHVFSKNHISKFLEASHQAPRNSSLERQADICCSMAVAAIGAQYRCEAAAMESSLSRAFYGLACHYIEAVLQVRPLDEIKALTLLCLYNITSNTDEAARKRENASDSGGSEADRAECYKTWCTLAVMSSWLPVSFGILLSVKLPGSKGSTRIEEGVRTEMAEVALLNFQAKKTLRNVEQLTPGSLQSVREWLYHLHLLHLAGLMLYYRRIAISNESGGIVLPQEEGVTAAKTSARILRLLFDDESILAHCWLTTLHARRSCVLLLHCIAQKQIHKQMEWEAELQGVRDCLDVLRFCSTYNTVAARFCKELLSIHDLMVYKRPSWIDLMKIGDALLHMLD
ncbi:hypothetical protein PG990_001603 [Apiospora arundinis]